MRRRIINAFLGLWLAVMVIDGFRPLNDAHAWLAETIHYPLTITGLWSGPWRLFGPDVDKVNLRLDADIELADGTHVPWHSPDWPHVSAWHKFTSARETNYFANILKAGQEPAWEGLCKYLARQQAKPVASVTLILRGADVPPPDHPTPAEPFVAFDPPNPIYRCTP